jgi:acyl carrier protein
MSLESEVLAVVQAHAGAAALDAPLDLDSLTLVVLVEELEARCGIVVPARDLVPGHFGTAARVVAYVARRKEQP